MSDTKPVVMVCTVGGSPDPLRTSISFHRPSHVIYVASPQSRPTIRSGIEQGLEWRIGDTHIVTLSNFQDIVQSVRDIRHGIAQGLAAMGLPEDTPLIADITGGSKIMSAALALVMMEYRGRFSYVGGERRSKGGLGTVESGSESVVQDANPWDVLALREARALAWAFNHGQLADALKLALALKENMDEPVRQKFYAAIADMVQGYKSWDSFDHDGALPMLRQAKNRLEPYAAGNERISKMLHALQADLERLQAVQEDAARLIQNKPVENENAGSAYLLDLLGNARRRAAAGHYDDAVARLYSAIEKAAKCALWARHGIDNGHVDLGQVPESIRDGWLHLADADGIARVGLERSYQLLAALDDPLGKAFLEEESALKAALESRNTSLLAHGYVPVGSDKYERLLAVALKFLQTESANLPGFPELDWKALLL